MKRLVLLITFLISTPYLAGCFGGDIEEITEEQSEIKPEPTNLVPVIMMWDQTIAYGSQSILTGTLWDEFIDQTLIEIKVFESNTDENPIFSETIEPISDVWNLDLNLSEPGDYIVSAIITDIEGKLGAEKRVIFTIEMPIEPEARLLVAYEADPINENESTGGTLYGSINHEFVESCSISYLPSFGGVIHGLVDSENHTFSIQVSSQINKTGNIIAICGLWTVTTVSVQYQIPASEEVVSEKDSDSDGIIDSEDKCPDSNGFVNPEGCSEDQIDSDGDGVSDSEDQCEGYDDNIDLDDDNIVDGCDEIIDSDNDGIDDEVDQCKYDPETENGYQDDDGCPDEAPITWTPQDSWLCQDGTGPWVKDYNSEEGYDANTNGASSAGASDDNSGPWFQCDVVVTTTDGEMIVNANGIPNHDFLSTRGCCTDEVELEWHISLNPMNDTTGGHTSTNCPASNGRWECAPDRGAVAVAVNGVPMYGPEEGPGGDAVALHFSYFDEDRQPIFLGWCTSHSAGASFHYHYDAQCQFWDSEIGEDMSDYEIDKLQDDYHSPIIGWAFDGYPIYGMYGYGDDGQSIKAITSSYAIERTQEGGDQGYNGIDDWNYYEGLGDLDECNGRFGPTPEYPEGIYHYVSTPLSGDPTLVTDTDGNQVSMIGFPYFLLCYHGIADTNSQSGDGGQGGGDPDCSGHGETWGPGIGPPPEGCGGGPQSTQGYSYNSQSTISNELTYEDNSKFVFAILTSLAVISYLTSRFVNLNQSSHPSASG